MRSSHGRGECSSQGDGKPTIDVNALNDSFSPISGRELSILCVVLGPASWQSERGASPETSRAKRYTSLTR